MRAIPDLVLSDYTVDPCYIEIHIVCNDSVVKGTQTNGGNQKGMGMLTMSRVLAIIIQHQANGWRGTLTGDYSRDTSKMTLIFTR